MAGHSHWANIKHQKKKEDRRRAKIFTKLVREITVAARQGGGDPEFNIQLRLAIDRAKDGNMPKENIERAIKRGTGELEGVDLEEIVYEGYAPSGVAVLVHAVTDNKNRTASELRKAFSDSGGSLAEAGAVTWQFDRRGYIALEPDGLDEEHVFEIAVEAGAEDIEFGDDLIEIYATPDRFSSVQKALEKAEIPTRDARLTMVPKRRMTLGERETLNVMRVIERLEDMDDVQEVHSNLEITDEIIAKYEGEL
ncbi:MAG: YebC/PmpR family DNA-binding transcriptional regulator [Anaerolineae bacterium]|nr:YebC/PmpR family DNA-binding transcriptional regulator [Anaerolineae bacterium]